MNDAAVKPVVMEATNSKEECLKVDEEKHQVTEHEKDKEEQEKQQEVWERIYKENAESLELSGGWFILVGTIIVALGETKDFIQGTEDGKYGVDRKRCRGVWQCFTSYWYCQSVRCRTFTAIFNLLVLDVGYKREGTLQMQ